MNKGAIGTLGGLGFLMGALACGGLGGPSYDNLAACTEYVDAMNSLECLQVDYEVTSMCQPSLDQVPCDLAGYYRCMAAAAKCDGDIPDLKGQTECGAPTCGGF